MKQGKRSLRIASFIAALFLVSGVGMAQIQIEWPDPTPFGNTVEMKVDTAIDVSGLNLGAAGAQTWDFTAVGNTVDLWTVETKTVEVTGSPFAAAFPTAEWADKAWMYVPAFLTEPAGVDSLFAYMRLEGGWIEELGMGTNNDIMQGSPFVYPTPASVYPDPLTWNSPGWNEKRHFEPSLLNIWPATVDDSTYVTVDAWGTLTVPSGTYDCLRLKRQEFRTIASAVYDDILQTYTYVWVTEGFNKVLSVTADQSEGEDFTTALYVFLANTPLPTDVDEGCDPDCDDDQILPDSWNLGQNYPNPFNPTTTIRYVLPQPAQVELKVFSMLGQEVTTLELSTKTPGEHLTLWDGKDFNGKDVPGGVYFYRLKATSLDGKTFVQTKKMIMTK